MADSFLLLLLGLSVFFLAFWIIPLFIPAGRRERGIIYVVELLPVLFVWYKIRWANALLVGRTFWGPREVHLLRTFLLVAVGITALFLLYQFIPSKSSET